MRITVDLNVVLDVVQKRESLYAASAAVLSRVADGTVTGALPAHAFTTLHYIVERYAGPDKAGELVDWLIRDFDVAEAGRDELVYARKLGFPYFEDGVVAACAARAGSDFIVTRNISDFRTSPVPAITPEEFLAGGPSHEGG